MSTGFQGPSSGDPLRGLRSLSTQVHAQKQTLIDAAGLTLVRAIKLTLSEPGTGRVYRRGSRRATAGKRRAARIVLHRASAPEQRVPVIRRRWTRVGSGTRSPTIASAGGSARTSSTRRTSRTAPRG